MTRRKKKGEKKPESRDEKGREAGRRGKKLKDILAEKKLREGRENWGRKKWRIFKSRN